MVSVAPISMGMINSGRPMANGTPIGMNRLLAAPKVAEEMAVCTWFWRCTERNLLSSEMGMREMMMTIKAPMIEVLAEMPSVTIIWIPTTEPRMETMMRTTRINGSSTRGFFCSDIAGVWASMLFSWLFSRMSLCHGLRSLKWNMLQEAEGSCLEGHGVEGIERDIDPTAMRRRADSPMSMASPGNTLIGVPSAAV